MLLAVCLLGNTSISYGQGINRDSINQARQRGLDSTRNARQHFSDSVKTARQHNLDSIKTVRKHVTDSLTAVRKYRESKHYRDSVDAARADRVAGLHDAQVSRMDSLKAARQALTDSMVTARQQASDSVRDLQKMRSDSVAAVRQYKQSKRYQDSVAITRRQFTDSLHAVRQAFNDSLVIVRQQIKDSTVAARKAASDAMTTARKKASDSLTAFRKAHSDSLATARANRDKRVKAQQDQKQKNRDLALTIQFKKKHEAWNNTQMLKKKWGFPRNVMQNTFTRYNYYFNANKKMDEAEANMLRISKDNYDSLIQLYSFNPDRDSTVLSSDMDSIIQHASLGVQIHDPRSKWADDLYLLLGQAYYYKGNYEQAEASFQYIIGTRQQQKADRAKKNGTSRASAADNLNKNKLAEEDKQGILEALRHKPAANDALLWLLRTYIQSGQYEKSEAIIDLLSSEPSLSPAMKAGLAEQKAFLALHQGDPAEASRQLTNVVAEKDLPIELRRRAAFLNGQLLQQLNKPADAAVQYREVLSLNPKIDLEFYTRRNLAYALLQSGDDQDKAVASLKNIVHDNKYTAYQEQIYYILGRLAANSGNTADAINYLQKSVRAPKTTRKQKAISFAALGNVFYNTGNYEMAQVSYDSVSAFSSAAKDDTLVAQAIKRGKVLHEVTDPLNVIYKQDSLLALAAMSDKEQKAVVKRYLRMLEDRRSDSLSHAQNPGATPTPDDNGGVTDADSNPAYSWYFSNPTLMQSGLTDFKRKWGNRPLADNWRRLSAIVVPHDSLTTASGVPTDSNGKPIHIALGDDRPMLDANGLPTEDYLLSRIPNTEAQKELARALLQRAYMDLGIAYINRLDDYSRGKIALDTLDQRFPAHTYKAEELYLRYQMAVRQNDLVLAQTLANQILAQYADSKYAGYVRPMENKNSGTMYADAGNSVSAFYDLTYSMLQERQYEDVLQRVNVANNRFNDPKFTNRFTMVRAAALAGNGDYNNADTLLKDFIKKNPGDTLRPWAERILDYIRANKPAAPPPAAIPKDSVTTVGTVGVLPTPGKDSSGVVTSLPADSLGGGANVPAEFTYKPTEQHYFVFSFNKMDGKAMALKAELDNLNNTKYTSQHLATNMEMIQGPAGFVEVKTFNNAAQATVYITDFTGSSLLLKNYAPEDYSVFIISASNFQKLMKDKGVAAYMSFYRSRYK